MRMLFELRGVLIEKRGFPMLQEILQPHTGNDQCKVVDYSHGAIQALTIALPANQMAIHSAPETAMLKTTAALTFSFATRARSRWLSHSSCSVISGPTHSVQDKVRFVPQMSRAFRAPPHLRQLVACGTIS